MSPVVYNTKFKAQIALAEKQRDDPGGWFIDQNPNGWFILRRRCRSCGAALVRGRCPVDKKDCGR
jgi:hypothetical protein